MADDFSAWFWHTAGMMSETVGQPKQKESSNGRKLLVVDDCARTRAALVALLAVWGEETGVFTLTTASNGQEGVELCQQNPPDLIIMDVKMPVMNGLEASRLIKQAQPTVKIIILSLYANYKSEAFTVGADAFLVKSGSPAKLLEMIHNLIA